MFPKFAIYRIDSLNYVCIDEVILERKNILCLTKIKKKYEYVFGLFNEEVGKQIKGEVLCNFVEHLKVEGKDQGRYWLLTGKFIQTACTNIRVCPVMFAVVQLRVSTTFEQ